LSLCSLTLGYQSNFEIASGQKAGTLSSFSPFFHGILVVERSKKQGQSLPVNCNLTPSYNYRRPATIFIFCRRRRHRRRHVIIR
jgi:hypothetical protein